MDLVECAIETVEGLLDLRRETRRIRSSQGGLEFRRFRRRQQACAALRDLYRYLTSGELPGIR